MPWTGDELASSPSLTAWSKSAEERRAPCARSRADRGASVARSYFHDQITQTRHIVRRETYCLDCHGRAVPKRRKIVVRLFLLASLLAPTQAFAQAATQPAPVTVSKETCKSLCQRALATPDLSAGDRAVLSQCMIIKGCSYGPAPPSLATEGPLNSRFLDWLGSWLPSDGRV